MAYGSDSAIASRVLGAEEENTARKQRKYLPRHNETCDTANAYSAVSLQCSDDGEGLPWQSMSTSKDSLPLQVRL